MRARVGFVAIYSRIINSAYHFQADSCVVIRRARTKCGYILAGAEQRKGEEERVRKAINNFSSVALAFAKGHVIGNI